MVTKMNDKLKDNPHLTRLRMDIEKAYVKEYADSITGMITLDVDMRDIRDDKPPVVIAGRFMGGELNAIGIGAGAIHNLLASYNLLDFHYSAEGKGVIPLAESSVEKVVSKFTPFTSILRCASRLPDIKVKVYNSDNKPPVFEMDAEYAINAFAIIDVLQNRYTKFESRLGAYIDEGCYNIARDYLYNPSKDAEKCLVNFMELDGLVDRNTVDYDGKRFPSISLDESISKFSLNETKVLEELKLVDDKQKVIKDALRKFKIQTVIAAINKLKIDDEDRDVLKSITPKEYAKAYVDRYALVIKHLTTAKLAIAKLKDATKVMEKPYAFDNLLEDTLNIMKLTDSRLALNCCN